MIIAILLVLLSYFYGCFSTARIVAKSFRSLNIYKVGTGFADTENIYQHVSKALGVLVGMLDILKSYAYLLCLEKLLHFMDKMAIPPDLSLLYNPNLMMIYGLAMLIGHCLPLTNKLRGGRGIFTYIGFLLYLTPYPMLITLIIAAVLVFGFKQIRFSQYTIVILPVVLTQFFSSFHKYLAFIPAQTTVSSFTSKLLIIAFIMGIINFILSKRLGEF